MKKLLLILSVGIVMLFTGCGSTHYTSFSLPTKKTSSIFVEVNQDSTSVGFIGIGNVKRTNYKYAFGAAATKTKEHGFKYFSMKFPNAILEQYRERKVTNIRDAYNACDSGDESFSKAYSFRILNGGYKCDKITHSWKANTISGRTLYSKVFFSIYMHNEDRKDNVTFNAQDVLDSKLLKGLNREYFVKNKR